MGEALFTTYSNRRKKGRRADKMLISSSIMKKIL